MKQYQENAKKNNVDIVLPSHLVYTAHDNYNITKDFITYVNKEYKP